MGGLVIPSQRGRNQPFREALLVALRLALEGLFPEGVLVGDSQSSTWLLGSSKVPHCGFLFDSTDTTTLALRAPGLAAALLTSLGFSWITGAREAEKEGTLLGTPTVCWVFARLISFDHYPSRKIVASRSYLYGRRGSQR